MTTIKDIITRNDSGKTDVCKWTYDTNYEDNSWETACIGELYLNGDSPEDIGMKFCCFCGKPLQECA